MFKLQFYSFKVHIIDMCKQAGCTWLAHVCVSF